MSVRNSHFYQDLRQEPVNLFISYSHKDDDYLNQLKQHLKPMERQGMIKVWCDREIEPGTKWNKEISDKLETADIVLLLISPGFFSSDFCTINEMDRALEKLEKGEVRLIPVIIEPVDWHDNPFAELQVLPEGAKPVSKWEDKNEAWLNVVENIKSMSKEILESRSIQGKSQVGQVIPTPVLNVVGRHNEIERVVLALKEYASVAITGIAGVGKTTVLAFSVQKIANLKTRKYSHICFHRIAEWGSREERLNQLLLSLISCLNPHISLKTENESIRFTQIQRLIENQSVLLVVDNADDNESMDIVQKIRSGLPKLVIAVTSRRSVWRDFEKVRVKGLPDADGIILFKEKYENFDIDEASLKSLCRRVKGHPMMITHLALEAQESRIPPEELIKQLQEFNIDRDLAIRFNSVFERLPEKCHGVLEVIGFLETDTLQVDLLKHVLNVSIEDLDSMADQWIIFIHPNRRRFTVHELIRTWCRNRLEGWKNQRTHLIPKIVEFYLQFLKRRRNGEPAELSDIDEEWPNILGLLDRILDPSSELDPQLALTLVDEAIGDHFDDPNGYIPRRQQMSSLLDEPQGEPQTKKRVERLLEECAKVGGLLAARIEKNLGHFFYWRGNFEKAELLFHLARERYRKHGKLEGEAATTWLLGYLEGDRNYYKESQELYQQGTYLAEQVTPPNQELVAIGHHLIGCSLYHQGRFLEAETEFLRAYGHIDKEKVPHLMARIQRRLAFVALRLGRLDEAEEKLKNVKFQVDQLNRPRDAARIARQMALLYLERGNLEEAEISLKQALKGFEELNARRGIGYTIHGLAILMRKQGKLTEAKQFCEKSREIAEETKSLYGRAAAYEELSNILETEGAHANEVDRQRRRAYCIYSVIGNQRAQDIKKKLEESGAMKPKLPENIKGILFDLMDTLAYLEEGAYERTQHDVANSLGIDFDQFKWAWDKSRESAQRGLFNTTSGRIKWAANQFQGVIGNNADREMAEKIELMAEKIELMWKNEVKLYEETPLLLDTLKKKKFVLAVISNGPVAMKCLKDLPGIASYLDYFLLSCEVGVSKPGKLIYQRSLDKLGLNPQQCIFVGDGNDQELDGANKLGMYTIKINRSQPLYASIKNTSLYWDLEVNNLEELLSLFKTT